MTTMSRRNFLKATILSAATMGLGITLGCGSDGNVELITGGEKFFPQSVGSGDPKQNSVILWTRVEDVSPGNTVQDIALRLQVSADKRFLDLVIDRDGLLAEAAHDNCIKVKVVDLEPGTVYFYRFLYLKDGRFLASNTGRTKTASAPDDNSPVRFALLCCQDYPGKYYNTLARLLQLGDLDFVLHVGDYIYETTNDPLFPITNDKRMIVFQDEAGAIRLDSDTMEIFAARSLSNYRDLYKTYRKDEMLRRLHEQAPFIVVWDDHEYSDDCHGATATYFDGRKKRNRYSAKKECGAGLL